MLPDQLFQLVTLSADLIIFLFVGYYLFKFHAREKELNKREGKVDTDYHQIVDNALSKERKILDDATSQAGKILGEASSEADQILSSTKHTSDASREVVDQALKKMMLDIQKEAADLARNFITSYQISLQQLSAESVGSFQTTAKELETDLQQDIKQFRETLLPNLQKELDEYKRSRLDQTEILIKSIIQKASGEILNKAISLEDHQNLIVESLEKAKKEGVFS